MEIKALIKKLQNRPEPQKKIILWSVVLAAGAILLIFWFSRTNQAMKNFSKEDFLNKFNPPPQIQEGFKKLSNLPGVDEELKKIGEIINTATPPGEGIAPFTE